MAIVRFALRLPHTSYALAAFIVFLGVSAVAVMSEDIFPEIGIPVMSVICAIRDAIPAGIQPSTWRRPWRASMRWRVRYRAKRQ
jgi:multidrug efflux pump subunit AcrB